VSEDHLAPPPPVHRDDLPPLAPARSELRGEYAAWMDRIDDELVGGALLVSDALPRVTAAFLASDRQAIPYTRTMCQDVGERVRFVEDQGFLMLAREAPVAGDLRRLVSVLRLITAVERSAALVRHVAELLDRVDPVGLPEPVRQQVDELGRCASDVFRDGVDAWRRRDGLAVTELDGADAAVDRLAKGLVDRSEHLTDAAELIALGLLARYWERIADHGVSFAQHSTFAVTGQRVEVGP
jgi:phosphate transport system protein